MTSELAAAVLENQRVHDHILRAEKRARRRRVDHLRPIQRLVRHLLLDELARYRRERRYPKNPDFRGRLAPYFIDHHGTRCAMAHLLEVGGQKDLALRISKERNNAYVRELVDSVELQSWLLQAGLGVEEAALIQPGYCFITEAYDCFCQHPYEGAAVGILISPVYVPQTGRDTRPHATVRLERVAGANLDVQEGSEIDVFVSVDTQPGDRILLVASSQVADGGAVKHEFRGYFPVNADSSVTCTKSSFSKTHPVPVDVALSALGANDTAKCEQILGAQDRGWTRKDPDCENMLGCQCNFPAQHDGLAIPAICSMGILLSILAYRQRRRR